MAVQGEQIVNVGTIEELTQLYPDCSVRHFPSSVVMPGIINAHTHLENTCLQDTVDYGPFHEWLPQLAKHTKALSNEQALDSARDGAHKSLRCGVTTIGDCSYTGGSFFALNDAGLRGVVFKEIICFDDRQARSAIAEWQATATELPSTTSNLVRFGISPHTPYTVSPRTFRLAMALAADSDLAVCTHVAESKAEQELIAHRKGPFAKRYAEMFDGVPKGLTSIEYVDSLGALTSQTLLVHCVHVSHDDILRISDQGSTVAHCPRSNANLQCGEAPLSKFLEAKVPICLGTDGLGSTDSLSPLDEAAYTFCHRQPPTQISETLIRMITIDAARALRLEEKIGSLEIGKSADITIVKLPAAALGDDSNIYESLLRSKQRRVVLTMVNGKVRFEANF